MQSYTPSASLTSNTIPNDIIGYSSEMNYDNANFKNNVFPNIQEVKNSFTANEFATKYHKILAKAEDNMVKTETIKLSTATIIETLRNCFNKEDPDDETKVNSYMNTVIEENIELKQWIKKLNEIKNKNKITEIKNDYIEIEESEDKDISDFDLYDKANNEINKLLQKRRQEIGSFFPETDQDVLDRIFNTQIQNNKNDTKNDNKNDNKNDIINNENNIIKKESVDWDNIDLLFVKYNIPASITNMLHGLEDFKKELNDTHERFLSVKKTIDKFNNVITSQINWVSNMPNIFDNTIIMENIEHTIKKYIEQDDIINLFKEYKDTYTKMMLMITFIPREFISNDTCAICVTDEHNIVFVPCGHICCETCSKSITSCMVCRSKIDKKQKMFKC